MRTRPSIHTELIQTTHLNNGIIYLLGEKKKKSFGLEYVRMQKKKKVLSQRSEKYLL